MSKTEEALPPLPEKRWAGFCGKCNSVTKFQERPNTKAAPCGRCGYATFCEELDYSDDEMRDYARAALAQRQQVPEGNNDVRAALARLIEVYDAMGCPRGVARIMAESALTAVPHAPFLFVAMDDDKQAHLTWCADEAAVREAVKGAMFWLPDGEELDADNLLQLDGVVEELLDSGAMIFEGDAPLYLYRVATAPALTAAPSAQAEQHVGDSSFEGWFASYDPAGKGDKQRARDAYAAGMGDAAAAPSAQAEPQVPLTDEQAFAVIGNVSNIGDALRILRATEAAHGIGKRES